MDTIIPSLHIVICTYNRSDQLAHTLQSIAGQSTISNACWRVLVVDNNCTDATPQVIEQFSSQIPGLEHVHEPRQGLTEARQCGVHHTHAPWIAFVDDDCILDTHWVDEVLAFCKAQPDAAGFNGRNVLILDGDSKYPWIHPGMFAGHDPGGETAVRMNGSLHGAGLVLRRDALLRSGWLEQPFAQDRRGNSLVSGGDNELAMRTGAGGGDLWFVPACRLVHKVTQDRLGLSYLCRLNYRLAEAGPTLNLMSSSDRMSRWHRHMIKGSTLQVARGLGLRPDPMWLSGGGWRAWVLSVCRAAGQAVGYTRLLFSVRNRQALHGLATAEYVTQRQNQ